MILSVVIIASVHETDQDSKIAYIRTRLSRHMIKQAGITVGQYSSAVEHINIQR